VKSIPLTKGYEAVVDNKDYHFLISWDWSIDGHGYAQRAHCHGETKMHRLIAARMGLDMRRTIDHKDRNKLNNQRQNLREATKAQQMANLGPLPNRPYRGVSLHRQSGCWRARINQHHIGLYDTPQEAAIAFNQEALRRWGEFAYQNEVQHP
jgi:hypothetical protein